MSEPGGRWISCTQQNLEKVVAEGKTCLAGRSACNAKKVAAGMH